MTWQSSILPLLLLINTGVALFIFQAAWRRRSIRGATPFSWMLLAVAIWSFSAAMELLVEGVGEKVIWSKLQYFGITSLPALWLLFTHEYSQVSDKPLRHRPVVLGLLWCIPILTLVLVFSNQSHGWIWSNITPIQSGSQTYFLFEHGPWFWVFAIYGYITLMAGTLILVFAAARFPSEYRRQTIMLLIGAAIPWIANIAYLLGSVSWAMTDLTPIAFSVTGVIYAYEVFRFQLFDLAPVAHDTIVENLVDGIVVLDAENRVIYINQAAQKLLHANNVIGKHARDAFNTLPEIARNGPSENHRVIELHSEGFSQRTVDLHANPLHDQRGRLTGQVIVLSDITEQKREAERFRLLIETAPDSILILDQRGFISMANLRVEKMLGYPPAELISQPIAAIIPKFFTNSSEMLNADLLKSNDLDQLNGRDLSAICKDGRELPVQVNLSQIDTPDGPLILATLRDITLQKATEAKLNQQSVALTATASAIMITNRDGQIIWVNPSFTKITGYTPEEAIGNNPSLLKSGLHDQNFYADLWRTILAGKNWHGELVNRRKDGALITEDTTIAPVMNEQGEITHFIAINQNITKHKELEHMRDELMQTIVHDLRNPLTSILFALDMIKDLPETLRLPPEMAMMLAISRDNSWRMLGMVNAMLDYSKLETGKMPLQPEPITLAELVEQSFRFQSQLAARRELLLLNDVPYDLPDLTADRTLLSRVLQNLIDNAIKFAPQGSNIVIKAGLERSRQAMVVSVHDDGPGIPPELRSQLFQKFAAGSSPRGGTGLGLAFCRLAIEAHHGEIWVESEADQGTTFSFTLPFDYTASSKRSY